MHATQLWSAWQAPALDFAAGFPPRGRRRFVEWVTGLALNVEEHTLTQSLVGLDRPQDGRALESFAEYGSWYLPSLEWNAAWRIDRLPGRLWHGYRVWAGDDTKVHRNSPGVWGTCTFHEHSARCPNPPPPLPHPHRPRPPHHLGRPPPLLPGARGPAPFPPRAGPPLLPPSPAARRRAVPHQVPAAGRAAAVAGGPDERAGFGGLRRRLRPAERGPAAGPPGRPAAAARRGRHPAAAPRPPAPPAAAGPAARPARAAAAPGAAAGAPAATRPRAPP